MSYGVVVRQAIDAANAKRTAAAAPPGQSMQLSAPGGATGGTLQGALAQQQTTLGPKPNVTPAPAAGSVPTPVSVGGAAPVTKMAPAPNMTPGPGIGTGTTGGAMTFGSTPAMPVLKAPTMTSGPGVGAPPTGGSTVTSANLGANPTAGMSNFVDTRANNVTAPPSALQSQASGQVGQALASLQQASTPQPFQSIATTNAAPTTGLLQQALQQAQSPQAAQLQQQTMSGLRDLSSAPDRATLAANALKLQRDATEPQYQQDLRAVGQKAAALGRIGSGMTTSELGDVTLQREKALGQYGAQLANDAAGQTLTDRLGVFDRTAGLQSSMAGQDLAQAGFTQGNALDQFNVGNAVRDQSVNERSAESQAQNQRAALQQALLQSASGVQGQEFNQGMQTAGLETQQQQWQNQLAQQGIQNATQQQTLQEALLNGQFNRALQASQAQANYGSERDPTATQLAGSQQTQQQASQQQDQLSQLMQYLAMQQSGATPTYNPYPQTTSNG